MMEKIKERLTSNYEKDVIEYLETLKTKGFIIVNNDLGNKSIYHYSTKYDGYIESDKTITSIIEDIKTNEAVNYFDVDIDFNVYVDLILKTLPSVHADDLDSFRKYHIAKSKIIDSKELKKDLKKLEADLKQKQRPLLKNAPDDVIEQIQALINNNIVCTIEKATLYKKTNFYQYNKQQDRFIKVSPSDMQKLFTKEFNLETDINKRVIERNRAGMYVDLGFKSQLPVIYNDNKEYEVIIKKEKNSVLNKLLEEYN